MTRSSTLKYFYHIPYFPSTFLLLTTIRVRRFHNSLMIPGTPYINDNLALGILVRRS